MRYMIDCPACRVYSSARKMTDGKFMCLNCYSSFENEVPVIDVEETEKYKQEYKGAKIAGMLSESEFANDRIEKF
jgi:protein-arginine kinase activator protein McsA